MQDSALPRPSIAIITICPLSSSIIVKDYLIYLEVGVEANERGIIGAVEVIEVQIATLGSPAMIAYWSCQEIRITDFSTLVRERGGW